jgi:hypothetical protein
MSTPIEISSDEEVDNGPQAKEFALLFHFCCIL